MKNHGLESMTRDTTITKCLLIVQLEIPQISHNLFGLSAQISQSFGIFLKIALITCPLSMGLRNSHSSTRASKEGSCFGLEFG